MKRSDGHCQEQPSTRVIPANDLLSEIKILRTCESPVRRKKYEHIKDVKLAISSYEFYLNFAFGMSGGG
jgi:hypothetical protein